MNPATGSEDLSPANGYSSRLRSIALWAMGVALTCFSAMLLLAAQFDAFLDRCDAFHESPNGPLGWLTIGGFGAILVAFAYVMRPRVARLALAAGLVCFAVWSWWLLVPKGSC